MKAARRLQTFSLILPVAAAAMASAATSANATTYYVSQSSGNDSWSGQADSPDGTDGPFKTLAKSSKIECVPGDRILLRCGDTWNEELCPQGNGTPDNPIIIGSYGEGGKPVIDREDYNKDRIGIYLSDQEGFKIVGIEFNRCMTGICGEYSDECPTKRFIWIEDCYFHDSLLYQRYEDYPKRKIGLGICFFSHELENKVVLRDIRIKDCVFRRLASGVWTNSPDNFNKKASHIYNFANLTFEGCLFEEGYQWQMGIRGVDGGAVRNCVTHDIGRGFRSFNGVAGKTAKATPAVGEAGQTVRVVDDAPLDSKTESPLKPVPGIIHVEAESFSKPAGVFVHDCVLGGKQIYSPKYAPGWGTPPRIEYAVEVPETGIYGLTMRTAVANFEQSIQVAVGTDKPVSVKVPNTHGLWGTTPEVDVRLKKGTQTLTLTRPASQRGLALRYLELKAKK